MLFMWLKVLKETLNRFNWGIIFFADNIIMLFHFDAF